MKLSVNRFKSIFELENFEFKPLTMLTGINSSGKTSLVQSLLLLKQTLESESKEALILDGKYISASSVHELVFGKDETDLFAFTIELDKADLQKLSVFDENRITYIKYKVSFHVNSGVFVRSVDADMVINKVALGLSLLLDESINDGRKYKVTPKKFMVRQGNSEVDFSKPFNVAFSNFFPQFASRPDPNGDLTISMPFMDEVMKLVSAYFANIYYVGPLRVKPEPIISYTNDNFKNVGGDGLFTRFVLHNRKDDMVNAKENLLQATSRWICKELELADSIETIKDGTSSYRVVLRNKGVDVDLCHIGLGVSQILPIIVQGLLVPEGGTLIVDSPEVHMHPSVQADLIDFFIELAKNGRKVVFETHSDHMITRLRRRIAEGLDPNIVNLCFVTGTESGSTYASLGIDNTGTFFGGLPDKFMNTQDIDFRKIVEAKFAQHKR